MNRILPVLTFAALAATLASAGAQSWIFQPSTYTQAQGPQAPSTSAEPRAYATFTESQALDAAKLPRPAFRWDPSGTLGRGQRFEMWNHEEAMEAARMRTYAQGVRDAVGIPPLWTWKGPPHQPIPQIVAPTEKNPGKVRPAPRP